MARSIVSILGLMALTQTALVNADCTGRVGAIATALENYPVAQRFCSLEFPFTRSTSTVTAPTVTSTQTVDVTSTVTADPTTTTETDTSIELTTTTRTRTRTRTAVSTITITVTASANAAVNKRTALPEVAATVSASASASASVGVQADPRSSRLQSLRSSQRAFISSVCSCIEDASSTFTTTTTPVTGVTVTSTDTTTSTPTVTSTTTTTETETITVLAVSLTTITTTITSTSTTSESAPTATVVTCRAAGNVNSCARAGVSNSDCMCLAHVRNGRNICADTTTFTGSCTNNRDCAALTGNTDSRCVRTPAGNTCASIDSCQSSPSRMFRFARA